MDTFALHGPRIVRASASDPKRVVAQPEAMIGTLVNKPSSNVWPEPDEYEVFTDKVIEVDSVINNTTTGATISVIRTAEEG